MDRLEDEVLSEHFVTTTEMKPLAPTAPPIVVSCDLKRSYFEKNGSAAGRKLPAIIRANIFDYVVAASRFGILRIDELTRTVAATSGVATVKYALIDGKSEDGIVPRRPATPKSIDVVDVRVSDDL